jgi:hypothetical protein
MRKRKPDEPKRDRSVDKLIEKNQHLQQRGRKLQEQLAAFASQIAEARAKAQGARATRAAPSASGTFIT